MTVVGRLLLRYTGGDLSLSSAVGSGDWSRRRSARKSLHCCRLLCIWMKTWTGCR